MTLQTTTHDAITGKTITRDFTVDEQAQHDKDLADAATQAKLDKAAATAKASARTALLAKLGITADEAKLLLG